MASYFTVFFNLARSSLSLVGGPICQALNDVMTALADIARREQKTKDMQLGPNLQPPIHVCSQTITAPKPLDIPIKVGDLQEPSV